MKNTGRIRKLGGHTKIVTRQRLAPGVHEVPKPRSVWRFR